MPYAKTQPTPTASFSKKPRGLLPGLLLALLLSVSLFSRAWGQTAQPGIHLHGNYTGDVASNLGGGLERGTVYLDNVNLTVQNFISGITILLDRPFRVGHFIEVEGIYGTVESSVDMSLRIFLKDPMLEIPMHYEYVEKIREALREADIEIPFPHLQLFVDEAKAFEGTPLMQPYNPTTSRQEPSA